MNTTSATMNRAPSRSGIAWKVTLILIPIVTLGMLLWLRNLEVSALRQRTVSSYGSVPTFQLTNQNGQPFGSGQLAGKIWIADFIYTTCPGPCPMISGRMSELQKPLGEKRRASGFVQCRSGEGHTGGFAWLRGEITSRARTLGFFDRTKIRDL